MPLMVYDGTMNGERPSAEAFADSYDAETPVLVRGRQMTLGQARAWEALVCEASEAARQDDSKRFAEYVGMIAAAGALRPEHEQYVPQPE